MTPTYWLCWFVLSMTASCALAQSTLPPCAGKSTSAWSQCSGTLTSGKTIVYAGEFQKGKKHGQGEWLILQNAGQYDRYVGQFREGRMHGKGVYYYANGAKYEGEFAFDQFNGDGSFESAIGDRYDGQFRNGQFSGEGIYTFASGNVVQEGVFENGTFVRATKVQRRRSAPQADPIANGSPLNPSAVAARALRDAVAIVIGIQSYKNLPPARFASTDAQFFAEYAQRALGVRPEKIRLLTDESADEIAIMRTFRSWLLQNVNKGKTDIYIFYSGHGLPSEDGKSLYFLPHNADRDFIDKTAITQQELISMTEATGARAVMMFLDSCYSGQTRSGDPLFANARPVSIKSKTSGYPPSFTVFSASAPDQISWSSDALGHGIFSYYLMKGMEGAADIDNDGKITAGEMHAYLRENVNRQTAMINKKQDTQLMGDDERVLVAR
jgi:hypothetical protein